MEVHKRPLNTGETFCCSIKAAKELFTNTSVILDFAYLGRDYGTFAETPDRYFVQKNIKGRIVANMYMRSQYKSPILSFLVVKEKDFPSRYKDEFEQKYLPEFYRYYQELSNDQSLTATKKLMLVEFIDGKLKLHVTTLRF